jgi:hypothetical protein
MNDFATAPTANGAASRWTALVIATQPPRAHTPCCRPLDDVGRTGSEASVGPAGLGRPRNPLEWAVRFSSWGCAHELQQLRCFTDAPSTCCPNPPHAGLTFVDGQPTLPIFSDVWQIDAGVCLLSPVNGKVCRSVRDAGPACNVRVETSPYIYINRSRITSHAAPRFATVMALLSSTPWCAAATVLSMVRGAQRWRQPIAVCTPLTMAPLPPHPPSLAPVMATTGDALCGSCTRSAAFGVYPNCTLCPTMFGTACGNGEDRGMCDPVAGCVCNAAQHFARGKSGNCDSCEQGYWGLACQACPACSAHGSCDGSGTGGGSGACRCVGGWSGALCATPPSSAAVDGGAIAAGVIFGLLGAAALGVFAYARFFGGGPRVAAAWAAMRHAAARAFSASCFGGGAKAEKAALLRPTSSSAAAAARFEPIGFPESGGSIRLVPRDEAY